MAANSIVLLPGKVPGGALDDDADELLPEPKALLEHGSVVPAAATETALPSPPTTSQPVDDAEDQFLANAEVLAKHIMKQHMQRARVNDAVSAASRFAEKEGLDLAALSTQLLPLGVDLQQLSSTLQHMYKGLAECSSDKGWTLVSDGDLRLLYQHHQGTQVHSFKGSACLDAPMEQPLCLAREFDLINTWNRYMEETIILKETGAAELWVYCSVWLPWPFSSRDMLIHAQGMDLLDPEGCVVVAFEACDDNLPEGVVLPEAAAKRERIKVLPGSVMRLEPVRNIKGTCSANGHSHMTRGTAVCHVDATVPYVPSAIIQFVLRVFAPFMYHQVLRIIRKKFQDPQGPLPSRIRQRPELYGLISGQVAAFLSASEQGAQAAT